MAGISKETTAIMKIAIGSTEYQNVSIGDTLVWSAATAPAFVSAGASTGVANSSSVNVPYPSGGAGLDVVFIQIWSTSATVTGVPSGFTQLSGTPITTSGLGGGNDDTRWYVFTRPADGSETGTANFTLSSSKTRQAVALRFSGADTSTTPIDVVNSAYAGGSANTPAVSATTTGVNRLLIHWANKFDSASSHTAPSGFTERSSADVATLSHMVSTKAQAAAGATGSIAGSWNSSGSHGAILLALKPA